MIDDAAVYGASAVFTAIALAVSLVWLRRIPKRKRMYCYPIVAVLGFSTAMGALTATGGSLVSMPGVRQTFTSMADDLLAYPVLFGVTALLANESRRTVAVVVAVPTVQVLSFNVAAVVGGLVGLVCLLVVVAGYGVVGYLFLHPIWERAQRLPEAQRLLHWKSRNLLLFLIGMLIVFALLSVAQVFDDFVLATVSEYMGLLIRVGFAGFLFANVDAIEHDRAGLSDLVSGPRGGESVADGAD